VRTSRSRPAELANAGLRRSRRTERSRVRRRLGRVRLVHRGSVIHEAAKPPARPRLARRRPALPSASCPTSRPTSTGIRPPSADGRPTWPGRRRRVWSAGSRSSVSPIAGTASDTGHSRTLPTWWRRCSTRSRKRRRRHCCATARTTGRGRCVHCALDASASSSRRRSRDTRMPRDEGRRTDIDPNHAAVVDVSSRRAPAHRTGPGARRGQRGPVGRGSNGDVSPRRAARRVRGHQSRRRRGQPRPAAL
jgi:hypothetical protein